VLTVEKRAEFDAATAEEAQFLPLPGDLVALLGTSVVEYEALVVASLPETTAYARLAEIRAAGYHAEVDTSRTVEISGRRFDPGVPAARQGDWQGRGVAPIPVRGMAWVQFAYPIKDEWRSALESCGVSVLSQVPNRAALVSTPSLGAVHSCSSVRPYLATIEPVLSTDRARPELLDDAAPAEVTLAPGVTIADFLRTLPSGIDAEILREGSALPVLKLQGEGFGRRLLDDPGILWIEVTPGEPAPSDERQGQILARNWQPGVGGVPLQGQPRVPTEPTTGVFANTYIDWLTGRSLYTAPANPPAFFEQTVAVFDTGVDNGLTSFHPDIAARVKGSMDITVTPIQTGFGVENAQDTSTHGTNVIGGIIGAGGPDGRTGDTLFAAGQGVAPHASVLSVKMWKNPGECEQTTAGHAFATGRMEEAHAKVFNDTVTSPSGGLYPARIANHSWNNGTGYGSLSDRFESIARDADTGSSGHQAMALVFSAGNTGPNASTIGTPATAKNVITVGSVDSYNPQADEACGSPPATSSDPLDGPFVVSEFSARGKAFGPGVVPAAAVHNTRIKPDVVAPGWQIEGPRRFAGGCATGPCGANGVNPVTIPGPPAVYAYGRGTSFSAPPVSGALAVASAQLRKGRAAIDPPWMSGGIVASPTLLKAGVIATARSLGPVDSATQEVTCTNGDCRPSHHSGWGLVDLDRLTNEAVPVFVRNEQTQFSAAGQSWVSPPLVQGVAGQEVLVVVVWNDIPASPIGEALKRDLDLRLTSDSPFWVGNNFSENHIGVDNGYSYEFGFTDNSVADRVNNVEAIFLRPTTLLPEQEVRIRINYFAHTGSTTFPTQSFSVYAWNLQCRKDDGSVCLQW
jgi:hypothetical protein